MLDLSTCLKYYSRPEIQNAIVSCANDKELGVRYLNGSFGKRPDVLQNRADVLEFAKQNVSSFHISEEHWRNPLLLSPSLKKSELDNLRTGWDLIIDIDCVDWQLSKRIAYVVIKILMKHGIKSISCKFSGNKGFHIGVPFKALPLTVQRKETKLLFPEGVKRIMDYIIFYASKNHSEEILEKIDSKTVASKLGMEEKDILSIRCSKCDITYDEEKKQDIYQFFCDKCGTLSTLTKFEEYINCPKCKSTVKPIKNVQVSKVCKVCKSPLSRKIDLATVLGLDKILISPRHLYRMPYSLHEKSGLVSIPILPESILSFEKEMAKSESVKNILPFLDTSKTEVGEGAELILKAFDHKPELLNELDDKNSFFKDKKYVMTEADVEVEAQKIPIEMFPPCIKLILAGVKDGKKRAVFILINFLTSVGWGYNDIEELLTEWNKKNEDGLRETVLKGQLNYHKAHMKKTLPPNCSNKMYYIDIGVCKPDELCRTIKNPAQYAKKKALFANRNSRNSKKKLTKDDKLQEAKTDKNLNPEITSAASQ